MQPGSVERICVLPHAWDTIAAIVEVLPAKYVAELTAGKSNSRYLEGGGSPGTRTPNQLIKSQLLYH